LINQPHATLKSHAVYICEDVPIGQGAAVKFCENKLLAPCLWFIEGDFFDKFWRVCGRAVVVLIYLAFVKIVRFVLTGTFEV
jgi:hypothetical protein